jgi:hypothetical protein
LKIDSYDEKKLLKFNLNQRINFQDRYDLFYRSDFFGGDRCTLPKQYFGLRQ